MAADNISRISQHIPVHGIPSVRRAAKKPKDRDGDQQPSSQESLEDMVEITNNEQDTEVSIEQLDEYLRDEMNQGTDKAPGTLVNIVVK